MFHCIMSQFNFSVSGAKEFMHFNYTVWEISNFLHYLNNVKFLCLYFISSVVKKRSHTLSKDQVVRCIGVPALACHKVLPAARVQMTRVLPFFWNSPKTQH